MDTTSSHNYLHYTFIYSDVIFDLGPRSVFLRWARQGAKALLLTALGLLVTAASQAIVIDEFDSDAGPLILTTPADVGTSTSTTTLDANVLGGERDLQVILTSGAINNRSISGSVEVGFHFLELGASITGNSHLVWDGIDGNGSSLNPVGLGGIDLTEGGTLDAFQIGVDFGDQMTDIVIAVHTDGSNSSVANLSLPTAVNNPDRFIIPFSSFTALSGAGVDFTNVGAMTLTLGGSSVDLILEDISTVSVLTATKADSLLVDDDGDTQADPGDTLLYTVVLQNSDDAFDASATNVVFVSGAPEHTALVVGSVTSSQGTVTTGNTGGDTSVEVNVGDILDDSTATITFEVLIASPFNASASEISCQGTVTSDSLAGLPTDDPDTPLIPLDPTLTPIDAAPLVTAEKVDSVLGDDDMDGLADPGETLQYVVTVRNEGNQNAANVVFTSGTPPHTTLVDGSVIPSVGSVLIGNGSGDTGVVVDLGTLAGGGIETITFLVSIDTVVPATLSQILCQGVVAGDNFPDVPTDDPSTLDPEDPTGTTLDASPDIVAEKTGIVLIDGDDDGNADPGDTVQYEVVITNDGDRDAVGVVFESGVDPNTTLSIGSATTNVGAVTLGNDAGNTSVAVDVGTLAGGGDSVTITFLVTINNPLPAGVDTIVCQGLATGGNFPDVPTDDPTTTDLDDPTILSVDASPDIVALKTGAVLIDADGDMQADPGDTIRYTVDIANRGDRDASGVLFSSGVDPNTTLVVGSVTAPMGSNVILGNDPGHTSVLVELGTVGGQGGSRIVTFLARIDNPLAAGVRRILCQGLVTGDNFPDTLTDDPTSIDPDDMTETPVDAAVAIVATKADSLLIDTNSNGLVDAGDSVQYTVVVRNDGDQNASGVVFASGVDPNTTLTVGSVTTTSGTIASGNDAGNTTVGVSIGDLSGGGGFATITFIVQVSPNLPNDVSQIACQGTITGNNFTPRVTDDPATPTANDSTITPVVPPATPTPTFTATATPTPTVACVQTASLTFECRGGVGFAGAPGNMNIQFHLGASEVQTCGSAVCPTETLLVDCFLDCDQFVGTGCGFTLENLIDEIGACITDQAGTFMTWRRVTGMGLSVQSNTEFHVCLFSDELGTSADDRIGYAMPDAGCSVYSLCDGIERNEAGDPDDFTSGLGLTYKRGLCPGDPTPTPTSTLTPTVTWTPTPELVGCDSGYYLLDSLGGRHRVGVPPVITGSLFFGVEIARDLERATCVADGTPTHDLVVLDGLGVAHFVSNEACNISQDFFFADADPMAFPEGRAVDLEITEDSQGLWVLTDFGGIYRAGTAKVGGETALVAGTDRSGSLGFDVPLEGDMRDPNLPSPGGASLRAVSLVILDLDLNSQAEGYVVLDSMGGRFHYGPNGAPIAPGSAEGTPPNDPVRLLDPTFYTWPFFAGLDIARDIELHVTRQGVVILDGWDGIHPVPVDVESNPVYFATNLVPGTSSTPIQTVGMPYFKSGFDNPTTPEDESDSNVYGLDAHSIFTDLDFSAGCPDGLYTLDKFGGVFVMGEARTNEETPVPEFGNSPYFFPLFYAEDIELYAIDER